MLSPDASRCEARDEAPLCSLVESLTLPSLDSCVCGLDAFSPAPRWLCSPFANEDARGFILRADEMRSH